MRKLGELGATGAEARYRLKWLLDKGLKGLPDDLTVPLNDKARGFIRDMIEAVEVNEDFEPSPGQIFYAQDLFDRYLV